MIQGKTIVFIATVAWSRNWQRQHEWASRLAEHNRVLYVAPFGMTSMGPITILKKFKKEKGFAFEHPVNAAVQRDLQHVRLFFIPIRNIGWLNRLNSALLKWQLSKLQVLDGTRTLFWVCNPADTSVALLTRYPKSQVIYDIAMRFVLLPDAPGWIKTSQAQLARRADAIFFDAAAELEDLPTETHYKATYVPQGFDARVLSRTTVIDPRLNDIPHPRAVYIGISTVLDVALLNELLMRLPTLHIVMIGDVQPHPLEHPRLHWLGPVNVDKKDNLMKGCDVGLIPYTVTPYTAGTFPTKFFEYLALGLPVVSTDLPELRQFADSNILKNHVYLARDRAQFIVGVAAALKAKSERPDPFLREHTWDQRFAVVQSVLSRLQ